jgi:hypothetical protein
MLTTSFGEEMSIQLFNDIEPSSVATTASVSPIDAVPDDGDNLVDIFNIQGVMFFRDKEDISDEACSHIRSLYALFDYAAMYQAPHFASCEHIAPETLTQKVKLLSKPSNIQFSNLYKYMAQYIARQ